MGSFLFLVQILFAVIAVILFITFLSRRRVGVLLRALAYGAGAAVSYLQGDWIPLAAGLGAAILVSALRIGE